MTSKINLAGALLLVSSGCTGGGSSAGGGGSSGGNGGAALACLQRDWSCVLPDGSTAEMTIEGLSIAGSFMMAGAGATVESTFTLDGDVLSVTDTGGTGACPPDQLGVYAASCDNDMLSFTLMEDDCIGRMNFFGCGWVAN